MKRLLLLAAAAYGAVRLLRRRAGGPRVVVGWADGSELDLGSGAEQRDALVAIARGALS